MKLLIAVSLVGLVAMTALLRSQSASIQNLERQIEGLNAKLVEKSRAENLEVQAKCFEQARKAYADLGYPKGQIAGYENHYNSQLNRCFIHVANTDTKTAPGTIWNYQNVFDAFEGREYGAYAWHSENDKKDWAVAPVQCEVTLPSGVKKICRSDAEFSELIDVYMEEN